MTSILGLCRFRCAERIPGCSAAPAGIISSAAGALTGGFAASGMLPPVRAPAALEDFANSPRNQRLKFFRPEHRHEQIGEQAEGNESDKNVFHGSELSARVRVKNADAEERES